MTSRRPRAIPLATALAACLLAAPLLGAAAEPALKLSGSITLPAGPADKEERALLRLEWHAGQSRAEEAGIVDDMLARIDRMQVTVAEIGGLMRDMPATPAEAAEPPPQPALPVAAGEAGGLPWLPMAIGALGFFVLGWLWRQRTARARPEASPRILVETEPRQEPAAPPEPEPAPFGALAPEAVVHREPPPIAFAPPPPEAPPAPEAPRILEPLPFAPPEPRPAAMPETAAPAEGRQGLELAEIMVSMGLSHGAAQTLLDQIRKDPRDALYYWLKLLDVYRRSQQQGEFEAAARELRQHFNVQARAWEEVAVLASIEDYPHIAGRIAELWDRPAVQEYLERLLADNRGGTRAGFPQAVAEEILLLIEVRKDIAS